jgi:hypothetical protein
MRSTLLKQAEKKKGMMAAAAATMNLHQGRRTTKQLLLYRLACPMGPPTPPLPSPSDPPTAPEPGKAGDAAVAAATQSLDGGGDGGRRRQIPAGVTSRPRRPRCPAPIPSFRGSVATLTR